MKKIILLFIAITASVHSSTAQWQQTGLDSMIINCVAVYGKNVFACPWDTAVLISKDKGASWTTINNGPTYPIWSIESNGTTIYAGGYAGVFLSKDSGITWSATSITDISRVETIAVSWPNIFARTSKEFLLSTDNGITWEVVSKTGLPDNASIISVVACGENIFAGTESDGIFLSIDSCRSWIALNNNGLPYADTVFASVDFLTVVGTNIFAVIYNKHIGGNEVYLSTDNGESWTSVNKGLPNTGIYNGLTVNGTNVFAHSHGEGVFLFNSNDTSWTEINTGVLNTSVHSLAVSETEIYAATCGSGVFKRLLSDITGTNDVSTPCLPDRQALSMTSVYPNPATNYIEIETSSQAIIEILNIQGQLTLPAGRQVKTHTASGDKTSVDISAFPNGMYFVKVKNEKGIEVKKFVKQ